MTPFFYFDIETIPTQNPQVAAEIVANLKAPGNYKDPDKIAEYIRAETAGAVAKTSFDGFTGHVCAISVESADGQWGHCIKSIDRETDMLRTFFALFDEYHSEALVGHNIIGFDIPFLTRRAVVLGVKLPPANIWPRNIKPWSDKVHDTMLMAGGERFTGLDAMCRALGVPGKDGFDGSMVADAWKSGGYDKISDYCADDVARTKAVHQRFLAVGW